MGALCGCESKADVEIRKQLREAKKQISLKVLLLGTGESGKTTVIRQLIMEYGGKIPEEEKMKHRPIMLLNLVEGAYLLLEAIRHTDSRLADDASLLAAQVVREFYLGGNTNNSTGIHSLPPSVSRAINTLANEPKFLASTVFVASSVPDGWRYFVEKNREYPTWGGDQWRPSDDDMLHVRKRTIGTYTQKISVNDKNFQLVDVGGQKSERAKWVFLMQGISAMIYLQPASDYNQVLFEEPETNRYEDSMRTWGSVVRENKLKNPSLIVFLNKMDLLKEKFIDNRVPISSSFPHDPPVYNETESDQFNINQVQAWYKRSLLHELPADDNRAFALHAITAVNVETFKTAIKFIFIDQVDVMLGLI